MFGKRLTLFELFGFAVRVDVSWLVLAILISWTLAAGLFPHYYPDLPPGTYWWMGATGALGLFFSIIFHELSHSLVARRYGLRITGITLFVFGGVAEMDEEPVSPKAEFRMAVAGPISSVVLGLAFYGLHLGGAAAGWPQAVDGVVLYLAGINGILAAFNLVPAFPLDGGRMLRAALWGWKGRLRWATRVASRIGAGFGLALVLLGIVNVVGGNFIGGLWWFLIGLFVRGAADTAYQQVVFRQALQGIPVRRFAVVDPVTVAPSLTVAALVDDYFYRHYHKMFPVVERGRLLGCVTLREVKELPRERWPWTAVGEVARPCAADNTIAPELDAVKALAMMHRTGNSRLMVAEDGRLVGVVTLKDLLAFLSFRIDLGADEEEISSPGARGAGGRRP